MKLLHLALLVVTCVLLTACASDPSADTLKSPCVSNDRDNKAPCVRRSPVDNLIA